MNVVRTKYFSIRKYLGRNKLVLSFLLFYLEVRAKELSNRMTPHAGLRARTKL